MRDDHVDFLHQRVAAKVGEAALREGLAHAPAPPRGRTVRNQPHVVSMIRNVMRALRESGVFAELRRERRVDAGRGSSGMLRFGPPSGRAELERILLSARKIDRAVIAAWRRLSSRATAMARAAILLRSAEARVRSTRRRRSRPADACRRASRFSITVRRSARARSGKCGEDRHLQDVGAHP